MRQGLRRWQHHYIPARLLRTFPSYAPYCPLLPPFLFFYFAASPFSVAFNFHPDFYFYFFFIFRFVCAPGDVYLFAIKSSSRDVDRENQCVRLTPPCWRAIKSYRTFGGGGGYTCGICVWFFVWFLHLWSSSHVMKSCFPQFCQFSGQKKGQFTRDGCVSGSRSNGAAAAQHILLLKSIVVQSESMCAAVHVCGFLSRV